MYIILNFILKGNKYQHEKEENVNHIITTKYLNYFTEQYLALQNQHLCKVHVLVGEL